MQCITYHHAMGHFVMTVQQCWNVVTMNEVELHTAMLQWQLKKPVTMVSDDTNLFMETQWCVTIALAFEWWNIFNVVKWWTIPIQSKLIWFNLDVLMAVQMHTCACAHMTFWHCKFNDNHIVFEHSQSQLFHMCILSVKSLWCHFECHSNLIS